MFFFLVSCLEVLFTLSQLVRYPFVFRRRYLFECNFALLEANDASAVSVAPIFSVHQSDAKRVA